MVNCLTLWKTLGKKVKGVGGMEIISHTVCRPIIVIVKNHLTKTFFRSLNPFWNYLGSVLMMWPGNQIRE